MQAKAGRNAGQSKQNWKVFNAPMGKELRTNAGDHAFRETTATIDALAAPRERHRTAARVPARAMATFYD